MEAPRKKAWLQYLLIGLGALVPILLSFWVIWYVYTIVDNLLDPALTQILSIFGIAHDGWHRYIGNMFTVFLSILAIVIIGWVISTKIGRWFHSHFDWILERVNPLYNPIKKTVNLTLESLGSDGGLFSRVVAVKSEVVKDGYVFGLLLPECEKDFSDPKIPGTTLLSVFVIHGPIGNSGFSTVVPKSNTRAVNCTIASFLTQNNLRFGAGVSDLLRKQARHSNAE